VKKAQKEIFREGIISFLSGKKNCHFRPARGTSHYKPEMDDREEGKEGGQPGKKTDREEKIITRKGGNDKPH